MAKQKMLPQKATVQDISAQIAFWEKHLVKVTNIFTEEPTAANENWMKNVQIRLQNLKDEEANKGNRPTVEKPKFN